MSEARNQDLESQLKLQQELFAAHEAEHHHGDSHEVASLKK